MKQYPLILLTCFFAVTACCQKETSTSSETTTPVTTSATETSQETGKTEIAKNTPMKGTVSTKEEKAETKPDEEASGVSLHKENCARCHGADDYPKENSKMDSYKRLHTMVGMCDAQLGTELFPEELQSITDYLNNSFYKFKND
jgi:cytochrome c553